MRILKNILKRFFYACRVSLESPDLYPSGRYRDIDVGRQVKNYIDNMETTRHYASLLGAKYLNFLQPFGGSGKRQLSKFDVNANAHITRRLTLNGDNELNLLKEFYEKLRQKTKDKDYVFDLRNIFDGYKGEIYFDQVHCSDIGYDILAREIAQKIIESDKAPLNENKKTEKHLW